MKMSCGKGKADNSAAVARAMYDCGFYANGIIDFGSVKLLRGAGKAELIPGGICCAAIGVVGYNTDFPQCNLAKFATLGDYHKAVGEMLSSAVNVLKSIYPDNIFIPFCDDSPIDEVSAAVTAGLGFRGRNNLLIAEGLGSFLHIGEILTDLPCEPAGKGVKEDYSGCGSCGACLSACPGGAISYGGFDKTRCISYITQTKGELDGDLAELIRAGKTAWGCDICQNVCGYNAGIPSCAEAAPYAGGLSSEDISELSEKQYREKYKDSAFAWRGKKVMLRNLKLRGE